MTQGAIRDGFAHLRTDKEMRPLADAARCRSEADWLIGINGTRAMTAFNSQEGGFHKTPVGRVQTPTLAILVEREERIRAFRPRDYWEVEGEFRALPATTAAAGSTKSSANPMMSTPGPNAFGTSRQSRSHPPEVPRQARHGGGGEQADDQAVTAAVRSHLAAARGQRPLRLFRQDHAGDWRRRSTKSTRR